MADPMVKYRFWLRVDANGNTPGVTKNAPALGIHERGMRIDLAIPRSVFIRPHMQATIAVTRDEQERATIDIQAAESALTEVLGCDVLMEIKPIEGD